MKLLFFNFRAFQIREEAGTARATATEGGG
jgi:hypothetical protein